jgi:hypothetical protein
MNNETEKFEIKEKEEKKEEENEEEYDLTIPDENLDQCERLADEVTIWAKLDKGGNGIVIESQGKILPELKGRILSIQPYLVKFSEDGPEKIPHVVNDLKIPKGFERRCDIKMNCGGTLIGLSLSKSSFKFQLSPYVKYLRKRGLRPEQVNTRIRTRMAKNHLGSWSIAVFDIAEDDQDNVKPQQPPKVDTPAEWR